MSTEITVRLSDQSIDSLDRVATQLERNREDVVRLAVESYLDELDDVATATDRLQDSTDPVLNWEEVKPVLFDSESKRC